MRAFVTSVVPFRLHARSHVRFKMFMFTQNQFLRDLPLETYYVGSTSRPFEFWRVEFLTPGTSDVILAASSSLEIFWPFSAVCLSVFLFEFWPRTFTIKLLRYGKKAYKIKDYDFWVQFSFTESDSVWRLDFVHETDSYTNRSDSVCCVCSFPLSK